MTRKVVAIAITYEIDVSDLPEWAEWFAADQNGDVYVYRDKPIIDNVYKVWTAETSQGVKLVGNIGDKIFSWRKTLTRLDSLDYRIVEEDRRLIPKEEE